MRYYSLRICGGLAGAYVDDNALSDPFDTFEDALTHMETRDQSMGDFLSILKIDGEFLTLIPEHDTGSE